MKIKLEVENYYENYDTQVTYPEADIDPPPAVPEDDADYQDWLYDCIFELTGTGHTKGNSGYFVKVLECEDPSLVGKEWEFV